MGSFSALASTLRNNRPSRKPQLWEDLPLALRRRVLIEVAERARPGWLDRAHIVDLSAAGWSADQPSLRMELFPRESMDRAIFLYGAFEISETRLVQALLESGMTFLDVGANSGYYSLIAARSVGPLGAVHGFEPNDTIRARFGRNVALNGFESCIRIHPEAISRESGEIRFYPSVTENMGISSTLPGPGRAAEPVVVPCVKLDDFVPTVGRRIDLLKIDVEGAEAAVFEGGGRSLGAPDGPSILFESFEIGPQLSALEALGYAVRRIHYTLAGGLDFRAPGERFDDIFAAYEAPNYFAAKDPAMFAKLSGRANSDRPVTLRVLGRI